MEDIRIDLNQFDEEARRTIDLLFDLRLELDWEEENGIAIIHPDDPTDSRIIQFIFHGCL